MTTAEKLKKLIREEVRKAVKEEMRNVLSEQHNVSSDYKSSLETQVKDKIPTSLYKPEDRKKSMPKFDKSNPFAQMLNETALNFSSEDARGWAGGAGQINANFQTQNTRVGDVNDMLASARKSSNIDMVEIDTVPSFHHIMNKFKEKGEI